jgi:hypothetical protein
MAASPLSHCGDDVEARTQDTTRGLEYWGMVVSEDDACPVAEIQADHRNSNRRYLRVDH